MFDFNRYPLLEEWAPHWPTILIFWLCCIVIGATLGFLFAVTVL